MLKRTKGGVVGFAAAMAGDGTIARFVADQPTACFVTAEEAAIAVSRYAKRPGFGTLEVLPVTNADADRLKAEAQAAEQKALADEAARVAAESAKIKNDKATFEAMREQAEGKLEPRRRKPRDES